MKLPELTGAFHISGMTTVLKDFEIMKNIRDIFIPLAQDPLRTFLPYMEPYGILKALENRLNFEGRNIIVSKEKAERSPRAQEQQDKRVGIEEQLAKAEMEAKAKNMDAQNENLLAGAEAQRAQAQATPCQGPCGQHRGRGQDHRRCARDAHQGEAGESETERTGEEMNEVGEREYSPEDFLGLQFSRRGGEGPPFAGAGAPGKDPPGIPRDRGGLKRPRRSDPARDRHAARHPRQ